MDRAVNFIHTRAQVNRKLVYTDPDGFSVWRQIPYAHSYVKDTNFELQTQVCGLSSISH